MTHTHPQTIKWIKLPNELQKRSHQYCHNCTLIHVLPTVHSNYKQQANGPSMSPAYHSVRNAYSLDVKREI